MSNLIGTIVTAILNSMRGPMSALDLEVALNTLAQQNPERLDWKRSIVDLLKLLKLDSSVEARRQLATELGYDGSAADGSAEKNTWLHKAVIEHLAKRSIVLPPHSTV
jgi:hypothetical protein